MKYNYLKIIIFLFVLSFQNVYTQEDFAVIKKNFNSRASGLSHNLNKTKDTLILKSPSKISYVYSINRDYKREIDSYIFDNEHKVPLTSLSHGKHVFVVGHQNMKIVFSVFINKEYAITIPKEEKLITANKDD